MHFIGLQWLSTSFTGATSSMEVVVRDGGFRESAAVQPLNLGPASDV